MELIGYAYHCLLLFICRPSNCFILVLVTSQYSNGSIKNDKDLYLNSEDLWFRNELFTSIPSGTNTCLLVLAVVVVVV